VLGLTENYVATLLIDQINATPLAAPGDTRPITYQLTPRPGI
jgi:hypothetical protein